MKKIWGRRHHRWVVFCIASLCVSSLLFTRVSSTSSPTLNTDHGETDSTVGRSSRQEQSGNHEIHCSRERSRAAWKIIEEYLMPFVEKERYQLSKKCRLNPDNDLYRDQEQHKSHRDINEWQCGYCKKVFYEEKHLDLHFDNRHSNLLDPSQRKCLADVCGALHCDFIVNSGSKKSKCNPAAAARNKHLCESLADSCFPLSEGPAAGRLHEFFLRQFCDAHTCTGSQKPFSRGRRFWFMWFSVFIQVPKIVICLVHGAIPFTSLPLLEPLPLPLCPNSQTP
ncbi:zinc finger protein [Senna tora]|uniref:Zinc finger protein n=1 Tax=Senna tora TaxID=362788 RepID=A0A834TZ80_9FABA|nr:zinc finger protein [Senna tora]